MPVRVEEQESVRKVSELTKNGKSGPGKRKGHQSTPPDCLRCPKGEIDLSQREKDRRAERQGLQTLVQDYKGVSYLLLALRISAGHS